MWFPVGPAGATVSIQRPRIGSPTVPRSYGYVPVQSSIKQTLLQSSFSSAAAARFRALQLPTWVSALFLTSPPRSQSASASTVLAGAGPGDLNRSSASARRLASLFHPAAKSRTFARSGACPLRAAFSLHQTGYAHAVQSSHAHLQAGCHERAPRLRRLAPHEAARHRFGV
jgi:hypothetical protein